MRGRSPLRRLKSRSPSRHVRFGSKASIVPGIVVVGHRTIGGGFLTTIQILAGTFGATLAGLVVNLAGLSKSTAAAQIAHGGLLSFALLPLIAVPFALPLLSLT